MTQTSNTINCKHCSKSMVSCSFNETGTTCPDVKCEGHDAQQVTIGGIVYDVIISQSLAQLEECGHHNIARVLRGNRGIRQLVLQRPKGTRFYFANEFMMSVHRPTELTYSKPFSM